MKRRQFLAALLTTLAALATSGGPACAGPITTTYLSDLPWASATTGFGSIGVDQSVKGNPLTLDGTVYAKGLGTHALSQIVYDLNGQYARFLGTVGVDDEVTTTGGPGSGSVVFQIFDDGVKVFDSGVMHQGQPTQSFDVSVAGVQQLTLAVGDGGDGIDYDHADWAGARLQGVPEPSSVVMLGAGLATIVGLAWRRRAA